MMRTRYRDTVTTLLTFAVPLIFSGILQQLYHWADAFIVGQVLGEGPLAAVGVATSVSYCINTMIIGFTTGLSVIAAQRYGSGDTDTVKKLLSGFLIILTVAICAVSLILMAAMYFMGGPFISIFGVEREALHIGAMFFKQSLYTI